MIKQQMYGGPHSSAGPPNPTTLLRQQHQRRSFGEVGEQVGLRSGPDVGQISVLAGLLHRREGQEAPADDQGNVVVPRRHVPRRDRLPARFRLPELVRSVIADRFFPNEMPDFIPETPKSSAFERSEDSLTKLLSLPYKTWGSSGRRVHDDCILYTGVLGTAYLLFKAYQISNNKDDLNLCSQIVKVKLLQIWATLTHCFKPYISHSLTRDNCKGSQLLQTQTVAHLSMPKQKQKF
ncbi:unnamed protein product [Camellia sinensis]